ncbi:MAG: hypothetical protein RIC57_05515 [Balneola sp.]|tara:strand:- start:15446 stop:16177 length:732 start_codon:yes stop_codon:yes gene_type:complete
MDQLRDYSDDRLVNGCVYCGGIGETKDHIPSRIFLDSPYPTNLPVVDACKECNNSFSKDEEYTACLIEAAFHGTTNPEEMRRLKIGKTLSYQSLLRSQIESCKEEINGEISFTPDETRVKNVILKLAKGHIAYEFSSIRRDKPSYFSFWPIHSMSLEEREDYELPHFLEIYGEVGSRALQRTMIIEMTQQTSSGYNKTIPFLMNDWLEVQNNRYRYLVYESKNKVGVKIVIGEYLACNVMWLN